MTDREISLPFRVDAQGRIAASTDPEKNGRQHVTTYLLTRPGERVMRPGFGTQMRDLVFENVDPLEFDILTRSVSDKIASDVPNATIHSLTAEDVSETGQIEVTVEFNLAIGAGQGITRTTKITGGA